MMSRLRFEAIFTSQTLPSRQNPFGACGCSVSPLADTKNDPVSIYLLKVKNRNTRTRCEIYSMLTIKTPE